MVEGGGLVVCTECGDTLPEGDYAHCVAEPAGGPRCLTCCTDFVEHCTDVARFEAEYDAWLKESMAEAERTLTEASRSGRGNYPLVPENRAVQ